MLGAGFQTEENDLETKKSFIASPIDRGLDPDSHHYILSIKLEQIVHIFRNEKKNSMRGRLESNDEQIKYKEHLEHTGPCKNIEEE